MMNLMVQYQAASRAATARSRRPSGCPTRSSGTACRGTSWSTLSRSRISAMAAPPGWSPWRCPSPPKVATACCAPGMEQGL